MKRSVLHLGIAKRLLHRRLCQKLLRDWSKKPLDNFDFAFLFKFSWFNSEETSNMSLKYLLNRGACSEDVVETVFRQLVDNPVKVLLIFDGLPEWMNSSIYEAALRIMRQAVRIV